MLAAQAEAGQLTPTKFLVGQFALTLVLILFSIWAATQWTADALGFQPRLGPALMYIGEYPVYLPWRFFQWWYAYDAYAPDLFARGGLIASTGGLAGIFMAVLASIHRARQDKASATYGSARWAGRLDLKRSGLLQGDGLMLGRLGRHYLRHSGAAHVIAVAPTRSGKGVGLVVPTLLSWTGSAIIHDIKGENWELTSRWRSSFSRCIRFDPTSLTSARFNPLLEVRAGHQDVRDVQNIADILVDPEGALERRNHWDKTAHSLLVGAILHVLYTGTDRTLAGVASLLSDPDRSIDETLENMMTANHLGTEDTPLTHSVVAEAARELLNKSENEKSSVVSTAVSFLTLYRDPVIRNATSASDWSVEDLIPGSDPVSLFLVVPPSDLSRTRPLIRLILNQIARRLCEEMPSPQRAKRPTLLMLDEFPALGRLDFFETSLAFMAGYGVRAFLIAQSLNQVDKAYGEKNAILDNCHVRIAFATNDERTARRISDMLGSKTEQRHQRNYAGHRLAPWLSQVMVSQQETQRPLMTPGEVMQMSAGDALVMIASVPPIRAKKLQYFRDRNFLTRTGSVPLPRAAVIPLQARAPVAVAADPADLASGRSRAQEAQRSAPEDGSPGGNPDAASHQAPEPRPNVRQEIARYFMQLGDKGFQD
jgi:type IV secretion system protein VirD4